MTPAEQAALAPFDVLFSAVAIGMVPHDAVTKFDSTTGYHFTDASGHTWQYYQVTRFEIARDSLDLDPNDGEQATVIMTFGQRYYYQNDGGKICLTRYTPHADPNSIPQQERRLKFKDAVIAWSALTADEKDFWKNHPEALSRRLPGRSLFISYFLRDLL